MSDHSSIAQHPIVVIAGQTASGKSEIALEVARAINGEIINADSRQAYQDMVIGTSSPIPEKHLSDKCFLVKGVPHHLYNFLDPAVGYNIALFRDEAERVISNMDPTHVPVLVGGSGLYIDSFIYNYDIHEESVDEARRQEWDRMNVEQLCELAGEEAVAQLNESDRGNKRRLIRILEGRDAPSANDARAHIYLVVDRDKEVIAENIKERTRLMIENGLVEENKKLIESGYQYEKTRGLNTIGYKEFAGYFEGEKTLEEVEADINLHTRQYAKRQRTWFRRHTDAVKIKNSEEAIRVVEPDYLLRK
ncbi:MAG: tRNA (adenosine(37)-N6)-dimethylallyltransferase MiaA [Candidatus Dojkabacteria bacterium]|nr:MAG: tRNA (adenosine(37)-N6)-dimethylallyltransferase MiaA [Candidatus Dojkabacteria bacterium]